MPVTTRTAFDVFRVAFLTFPDVLHNSKIIFEGIAGFRVQLHLGVLLFVVNCNCRMVYLEINKSKCTNFMRSAPTGVR
jgi:hypothetical protein